MGEAPTTAQVAAWCAARTDGGRAAPRYIPTGIWRMGAFRHRLAAPSKAINTDARKIHFGRVAARWLAR